MRTVCFISHAWRAGSDRTGGHSFALRIAAALRESGYDVWVDDEQMPPGTFIAPNIRAGIEHHSDVFLLLLSREALHSASCKEELATAIAAAKPIIVLSLRSCRVPPFLRDRIYLDFRRQSFDENLERLRAGIEKVVREEQLVRALRHREPHVRIEAARLLTDLRALKATQLLADRLYEEPDPDVQHWLLLLLGSLAHAGRKERRLILEVLTEFRNHESLRVSQGAEYALARMARPGPSRKPAKVVP